LLTWGGAVNDRNKPLKSSKRDTAPGGGRNGYWRYPIPPEEIPNIDELVIEDDEPVENFFVEKQYRLLTDPLYDSWDPRGRTFMALSNVGLFYAAKKPPLVPDVMLSLDVPVGGDPSLKENRSYFTWIVGKPPDVAIELVSDRRGGEEDFKKDEYARIGVRYYVIFDPEEFLRGGVLRAFNLVGAGYRRIQPSWLPRVELGLTLWQGTFQGMEETWLRWCDREGVVIATGNELAEQERKRLKQARQRTQRERQRTKQERQRAEQERQRAEQERQRAEQLAAQLRALGIKPKE
jgi:Uma2 family endonuclease